MTSRTFSCLHRCRVGINDVLDFSMIFYKGDYLEAMKVYESDFYRYSEYKHYSYVDPLGRRAGVIGHFTQLV